MCWAAVPAVRMLVRMPRKRHGERAQAQRPQEVHGPDPTSGLRPSSSQCLVAAAAERLRSPRGRCQVRLRTGNVGRGSGRP